MAIYIPRPPFKCPLANGYASILYEIASWKSDVIETHRRYHFEEPAVKVLVPMRQQAFSGQGGVRYLEKPSSAVHPEAARTKETPLRHRTTVAVDDARKQFGWFLGVPLYSYLAQLAIEALMLRDAPHKDILIYTATPHLGRRGERIGKQNSWVFCA